MATVTLKRKDVVAPAPADAEAQDQNAEAPVVTASVQTAPPTAPSGKVYRLSMILGILAVIALCVLIGLQLVEDNYYTGAFVRPVVTAQ